MIAQLALVLGALLLALAMCLLAARYGVLAVTVRKPPRPPAPKGEQP